MKTFREPFLATQVKGNTNWTCWLVNLWVLILYAWIFNKHITLMTLPCHIYLFLSPSLSFPLCPLSWLCLSFLLLLVFFNWGQHHLLDFRCCSRCCIFGSVFDYFKKCNISCVLSNQAVLYFTLSRNFFFKFCFRLSEKKNGCVVITTSASWFCFNKIKKKSQHLYRQNDGQSKYSVPV